MQSHNYIRVNEFGFCKMLLWMIILNSCCFRLTTQQRNFGFPGSFPNNGFAGPFPNNGFAPPPNRGIGPQTPSAIKVNSWLPPGQPLVFSNSGGGGGGNGAASPTTPSPSPSAPVFINNVPTNPTMAPFLPVATTPTTQFLQCFQRCPTTSEYNPICASNRQLYGNEQKFNCARGCGAAIQIVRRGSCEGLLPMTRG